MSNYEFLLYQPVEETLENATEEVPKTIKPLDNLISQLRDEEDYYPGEEHYTNLMITRLRKVFYDQWGWNSQVIRGAAHIKGRYVVKMIKEESPQTSKKNIGLGLRNNEYDYAGLIPSVVYSATDKVYPERAGTVPDIFKNDNQEVILPEGYLCDVAHILSGIDAMNYKAVITPLPKMVSKLYFLAPYVKSNVDFATWLGDLASTSGNILFKYLQTKKLNKEIDEEEIEEFSPASDMMGNIDAYVIASAYNINTSIGPRFTSILEDYYYNTKSIGYQLRKHRCFIFCSEMGLKNWKNGAFENEEEWIKEQKKQLRIATSFYCYGDLETCKGIIIALKVWLRFYEKEIQLDELLIAFLNTLKQEIEQEFNNEKIL